MARHAVPATVPLGSETGKAAHAGMQAGIVAAVLSLACLALLLTAPTDGNFWWQDAPRHALNGVFVRDFVAAHPFQDPVHWAIDYYFRRPSLTILFYPPMFYGVEALAFTLFGVSNFVAQCTVTLFLLLLAGSAYVLSRSVLPRWSALGAALLVIGAPETAFWGRQVMLEVPAYALILTSACFLAFYVKHGQPRAVYLAAGFLLAGIYTKYNAGFAAPALALYFFVAKGRAAWRDRHALIAAALAVVGLVPAIAIMTKFGAYNLESVSGLQGTIPLDSLGAWLFYIEALPSQLGALTVLLAAGGLVIMCRRFMRGPDRLSHALLLAWLAVGYLFFTLISLKDQRHTILVLLPLAIAAPLFLLAVLPRRVGEMAGLALGAGTLAYTLVFCPVMRVDGYKQIAEYLAAKVPHDGAVAYFGYRDANLVFDLSAIPGRPDISVVRIDKLLLSVPAGERRRGVKQVDYSEADIAAMVRNLGVSYVVLQPGFWSDLQVMARFDAVAHTADYRKVAHFGLSGDLSSQDGTEGIDILEPTYPMVERAARIRIDMPLAGQRFEGPAHQ